MTRLPRPRSRRGGTRSTVHIRTSAEDGGLLWLREAERVNMGFCLRDVAAPAVPSGARAAQYARDVTRSVSDKITWYSPPFSPAVKKPNLRRAGQTAN